MDTKHFLPLGAMLLHLLCRWRPDASSYGEPS